jgi:prophage regulatory protein
MSEFAIIYSKALRFSQVSDRTGLPRTTLYRLVKLGRFPRPHKLAERVSAWDEAAVEAWLSAKLSKVTK